MSQNRILIDSSFLFALFNAHERHHRAAQTFAVMSAAAWLVPDVTLVEVHFLINRFGGAPEMIKFLNFFETTAYELECLTSEDLQQVKHIITTYPRANFDFVDCCIMAMAERLNITQICTFDRRDFSIFRPRHCDYLELLP